MNQLSIDKRIKIIHALVEGNSIRAAARLTDVSFNTALHYLPLVGTACKEFHDEQVINVRARRVQLDEIWSFVYSKEKNVARNRRCQASAGDVWTWVGIDADTKLVLDWLVADRSAESANLFVMNIAERLANRVQLTTDGLRAYIDAVEDSFEGNIDYAQLVKQYGTREGDNRLQYIGAERTRICGNPDPRFITTSHIERQNLTMRMNMRRFTRKTNAFSKKFENHCHANALHFVYYNFVRIHKTLRVTPAMEAGLTNRIMEIGDIVELANAYREVENRPILC